MMAGTIFISGCIGAVAPEILRLHKWRRISSRFPQFVLSRYYLLVSLAYTLLGGYVAVVFPGADTPFIGMCIGCGLDTALNTMAKAGGLLTLSATEAARRIGRSGGRASSASVADEELRKGP